MSDRITEKPKRRRVEHANVGDMIARNLKWFFENTTDDKINKVPRDIVTFWRRYTGDERSSNDLYIILIIAEPLSHFFLDD